MARLEADREDLFAEATALARRVEIVGLGRSGPAVVGFRRDGGLSVYFDGDPVYHLDADGRLARAFRDGRLYRSQGDSLAELVRERTASETVLRRRDLRGEDLTAFLYEAAGRLNGLIADRGSAEAHVVRRTPPDDAEFWDDFETAVDRMIARPIDSRLAPRFRGKR